MSKSDTNYFVCTLGEAAQDDIDNPFSNVNDLIRKQSHDNPDLPAIGSFHVSADDNQDDLIPRVLTFKDVEIATFKTAKLLSDSFNLSKGKTVGLLAASSSDFLFTWLGCIWLGLPVLLIAPQCSASAIAHLCKSCNVSTLFFDKEHERLAEKACKQANDAQGHALSQCLMPSISLDDLLRPGADVSVEETDQATVSTDDIAYLHHTSGTSSGLPKPIPQSHHGAVGVLPALNGRDKATFTTTPLYHGGPADIFRAWSSNALIWLFPSKDMPITAKNVTKCLHAAREISQTQHLPLTKYFTSVPYILQMMAEDETGLRLLKDMDLVGVGGAALATEIGDNLVKEGVRLVSRFGAAECGFLLSSHRDYSDDIAWQYLRHRENVTQFHFEPREDDLYELVVHAEWPHMVKRNRDDGSYATSDLFAKHPDLPNAWRYHSRADSQLTLVTGKKFDPAPLEDAIVAASTHISDVLLFGNGKPYPGALLFLSKASQNAKSDDILAAVAPAVEKLNSESQSHAQIPRNMLVVMNHRDNPVSRSSKGTVLRKQAEKTYADEIEAAYTSIDDGESRCIPDDELPTAILDRIKSVLTHNEYLSPDEDLFAQGVDSVACVQIRHSISLLLPKATPRLSLTVVEDARTLKGLVEVVKKLRSGKAIDSTVNQRSQIPELVKQYSKLNHLEGQSQAYSNGATQQQTKRNILLTGPTGSLGAHVLSNLLTRPDIDHVFLLVRGASPEAARERVIKALSHRLLVIPGDFDQKVTIYQCKLSEPQLGISNEEYKTLQDEVDVIFHLAWSVNFLISLQSFAAHFAGIQNLLNLALSSSKPQNPHLIFCSSVAAVSEYCNLPGSPTKIPEKIATDVNSSGLTGYALSKLTAELILARAASSVKQLHKRITIIRVGQLSADTVHGIWNKSEAYPQILASAKFTNGILPDLGLEEKLTWLPTDIAAKAFVEACMESEEVMSNIPTEHVDHRYGPQKSTLELLKNEIDDTNTADAESVEIDTNAIRVLHLLNPDGYRTFTDLLIRLQDLLVARKPEGQSPAARQDTPIQIVPAHQWLDTLSALDSNDYDHAPKNPDSRSPEPQNPPHQLQSQAQPLLRLLPFWKQAYSSRQPSLPKSTDSNADNENIPNTKNDTLSPFSMHNSLITMPSLTYWLGLNTLEGHQAKDYSSETARLSVQRSGMIVNGHVREQINSHNQGHGDRGATIDEDVDTQLLRADYVLKLWDWVQENVP